MAQVIGVPRETFAGEKRVATVPEVVEKLIKLGFRVAVESGRGRGGEFHRRGLPRRRRRSGRRHLGQRRRRSSRCARRARPKSQKLRAGQTLIGFIWPAQNPELMQQLAARKATVLAMDSVPRI